MHESEIIGDVYGQRTRRLIQAAMFEGNSCCCIELECLTKCRGNRHWLSITTDRTVQCNSYYLDPNTELYKEVFSAWLSGAIHGPEPRGPHSAVLNSAWLFCCK